MKRMLFLLTAACSAPETAAVLETIATSDDGLSKPTDLEFHPEREGEFWIVNQKTDAVTIAYDADSGAPSFDNLKDPAANHFMERVSSIAFSDGLLFATCQDSTNTYDGEVDGNSFMGPALWTSDMDVFAGSNPEAIAFLTELFGFPVDLGSHLDMLHQSPNCMGIAWEKDNVYWVFDGFDGAIVRYDFVEDHGVGYDDHSDGIISRYAIDEVKRVRGTVSHMEIDRATGMLYIADSGNGRVAMLDTASGRRGRDRQAIEPGTDHHDMENYDFSTFVEGLVRPSGLAIADDHVIVADAGTGIIHVYDMLGTEVAMFDTELGAGDLAGVWAGGLDTIWFVANETEAVYRFQTDL